MTDDDAEREAMRRLDEDDVDGALDVILRAFGPRVFRMMMGVLHDDAAAQDVYQRFSIDLWRSLPKFRGESRVYTWTYTIARRAIGQKLRKAAKPEQRFDTRQEQEFAANATRTATAEWRKTESRDKFRELVEHLEPDDRTLVMLRIGESMAWNQIAEVLHDGPQPLEGQELARVSARLRKQFERIKSDLTAAMT